MHLQERVDNYHKVTGYPESLFIGGDGRLNGVWVMGNNYTVKSSYYGGYPHGYLQRVRALFPDKQHTLHLFSGQVGKDVFDGVTVDINAANLAEMQSKAEIAQRLILSGFDPADVLVTVGLPAIAHTGLPSSQLQQISTVNPDDPASAYEVQ